jgi:hypothetical protein
MSRKPARAYPQHRQVVFVMERQHPIVQQVSRRDRRFGGVELGMCHLAIGIRDTIEASAANTRELLDLAKTGTEEAYAPVKEAIAGLKTDKKAT